MHKYFKKAFSILNTILKGLQFGLLLLAFVTMVDFILFLVGIKLPGFLQTIFDVIYSIQSVFYKPNLEVLPVDFTLAIAAVAMLIVSGALIYIISFLEEIEKAYDKMHIEHCKKYEKKFNEKLEDDIKVLDSQNNYFALIYSISIDLAGRINPLMNKLDPALVETRKSEHNDSLKAELLKSFNTKCVNLDNTDVFFFDKFDDCEKVFAKFYEYTNQAREELKKDLMTLNFKVVTVIANSSDNYNNYLPKMQKLMNVAIQNTIMTVGDFKGKYVTLPTINYKVTGVGEYNFNNEVVDVYSLRPLSC